MADLREPLLDASQQPAPFPEADVEQQLIEGMSPPSNGALLFEDATTTHPLLAGSKTTATICVETESDVSTFLPCTFNLSKVILGASMMAIPKAFAILGVVLGSVLLTFCALLTAFTVDGLMDVSERLKITSYSELVRRTCGRTAQYLLQVGIALTCFGNMVIYLVVIADVLVGSSPAFSGVLPEVLHISPASHLLLSRPAVLAMVCLCVLLPLVSLRNMARLNPMNLIGNIAVFSFAACTGLFAVIATAKGEGFPIQWTPDWSYFHSGALSVFVQVAAIIPVLLNSDICQQCVHPLIPLLKPWSVARMNGVVASALTLCNTIYIGISIAMIVAFGPALDADALTNISAAALRPLVGHVAAHALACGVRLAFLISLVGSFALLMYPLRNVVLDLLPGTSSQSLAGGSAPSPYFLATSWALLAAIYAVAVYVPNIWLAISLVGSTAATLLAFIMPGLVIVLCAQHRCRAVRYAKRMLGAAVAAVGCFLFVNGVLTTLVFKQP